MIWPKRNRGSAAVEMAITMVVLIPLIFYMLFLEDFLYYKLEGQEPVISAAWDHVIPNYMEPPGPDKITGMNQLKYCDHTAAYDSYDRDFECFGSGDGLGHHNATAAHQSWEGGGQQITCEFSSDGRAAAEGMFPDKPPFKNFIHSNWNRGGLVTCSDRLNVFNTLIPKSISAEGGWLWGTKELTSKTQYGKSGGGNRAGDGKWDENYSQADVQSDGQEGGEGSWLFVTERLVMMVDPLALTHITEVSPDFGGAAATEVKPGKVKGEDRYHPLLDRTGNYYNYYAEAAVGFADDWNEAMQRAEFLDKASQIDTAGDHLGSVPVMWKPQLQREAKPEGFASGYADERMKQVQRGKTYPSAWGPNKR